MASTVARARPRRPARPAEPDETLKDLRRIGDLSREALVTLLRLARRFKLDPGFERTLLDGQTVVLHFNKPSTRTRISFETAVARLGGVPVSVGAAELQLGRGETIEDTARVISSYAAAFVIRTFSDDELARFAAASSIPVVNALTDKHHPCQALADLLTVLELWGGPDQRRIAYVGDGDNVCHSLLEGCALLGLDIAIATPPGHEPDAGILAAARAGARRGTIEVGNDPLEAVGGADAVYTDVWLSMNVPEAEREERLREFAPYRVDSRLMGFAKRDAVFMHCLPAHRGQEVTDEVIDGRRSVVFQQAANRLPTEQAVLSALISRRLPRRRR